MAAIASLLNPIVEHPPTPQLQLPSPVPSSYARELSPPPKKQKMTKDGAVFNKGRLRGELRYPPCETQDEELAIQHQRFELYPMGEIKQYPRHIPYNSEKKSFLEKTGRESFELFQYTFRLPREKQMNPGTDKEYVVMWDYNIGLVRMTPFFKCCNYSKTTPAKMLNLNPGLREICHSITGGALAAQGYWVPYDAAKAVAATFCYNIRYALTPLFGVDFVRLCFPPHHPNYGRMIISNEVVSRSGNQAEEFRRLAGMQFSSRESSFLHSPKTPSTPYSRWGRKSLRPKPVQIRGFETGYSTDSDHDDRYSISPSYHGYRNEWTPANTPRSAAFFSSPPPRSLLTSLPTTTTSVSTSSTADTDMGMESSPPTSSSGSGSITPTKRRLSQADEDYTEDDEGVSEVASDVEQPHEPITRRGEKSVDLARDVEAAYRLMKLGIADAALKCDEETHNGKKRRASA